MLLEADRLAYLAASLSGMKIYETPTACRKCGGFARYVSNRGCVPCMRARAQGKEPYMSRWLLPRTRKDAIEQGQAYFFPGRRCRRGHIHKRDVATNSCFECRYPRR